MILRHFYEPLLILAAFFNGVESSRGRNPCASHSGSAHWLMDHCEAKLSTFHLICSGGLHDKWDEGSESVRVLTLCRWPEDSFDPEEILSKFPALKTLRILDSNLTRLSDPFPSTAIELESLTFNGTNLEFLENDAFSGLPSLRFLDLSHNALSIVNSATFSGPSLERVYLVGNPFICVPEMMWILNVTNGSVARRLVDRDKLECTPSYFSRPLVSVMEIIEELAKRCLETVKVCTCELTHIGPTTRGRELRVFAEVNCSSKGLTEMPEYLPENTTTLYLMKNRITDLSPLAENSVYKEVIDVYLDDNQIESTAVLEDSDWLDHFRALSLRGNRLTDLQSYAFKNAFEKNHNVAGFYVGNNPWRCDCHFIPGFQDLLHGYDRLFKDSLDITCARIPGDKNSGKQIKDLSRTKICTPPDEHWLQPLDVLNVVLASLILFIIGKLLYDYWNFKKTGKLPWIVTKIP